MYVGIVRSVLIAEKGKMEGNLYKSGKKIKMVVKYSCMGLASCLLLRRRFIFIQSLVYSYIRYSSHTIYYVLNVGIF